mmetsp:Transcript_22919/g.52504  ORF Transcript_22919/g.52504 Transcript_22919/m.52504 type:complete len:201 (-) Transcript_22919:648-1250(-)
MKPNFAAVQLAFSMRICRNILLIIVRAFGTDLIDLCTNASFKRIDNRGITRTCLEHRIASAELASVRRIVGNRESKSTQMNANLVCATGERATKHDASATIVTETTELSARFLTPGADVKLSHTLIYTDERFVAQNPARILIHYDLGRNLERRKQRRAFALRRGLQRKLSFDTRKIVFRDGVRLDLVANRSSCACVQRQH